MFFSAPSRDSNRPSLAYETSMVPQDHCLRTFFFRLIPMGTVLQSVKQKFIDFINKIYQIIFFIQLGGVENEFKKVKIS
jgi:hypothetical protein